MPVPPLPAPPAPVSPMLEFVAALVGGEPFVPATLLGRPVPEAAGDAVVADAVPVAVLP